MVRGLFVWIEVVRNSVEGSLFAFTICLCSKSGLWFFQLEAGPEQRASLCCLPILTHRVLALEYLRFLFCFVLLFRKIKVI